AQHDELSALLARAGGVPLDGAEEQSAKPIGRFGGDRRRDGNDDAVGGIVGAQGLGDEQRQHENECGSPEAPESGGECCRRRGWGHAVVSTTVRVGRRSGLRSLYGVCEKGVERRSHARSKWSE